MTKNNENRFKVTYTNRDIIEKIDVVHNQLVKLTEHVARQNNRINYLEKFRSAVMYAFGTGFIALVGWLILISLKI